MSRERPDTVAELRHAEGKLLVWDSCATPRPCALQPRDVDVLGALGRYRFLTTVQIADMWWPGCALQVVRRRLAKLFAAGYVERFRPQTIRGAYQWIYCLARDGHRAAQQAGELGFDVRFTSRREQIFDYRYVVHDLRMNEWAMAYKRLAGDRMLCWHGPDGCKADPPTKLESYEHNRDVWDRTYSDLPLKVGRPIAPDAALEVVRPSGNLAYVLVEYDRTRRVDKNFDKFRRYEMFLSTWWSRHDHSERGRPWLVFVCEDEDQLWRFLNAADREFGASRAGEYDEAGGRRRRIFVARQATLFALAQDLFDGSSRAWRVPPIPLGQDGRSADDEAEQLQLPGAES
jgi:hypothetical protein